MLEENNFDINNEENQIEQPAFNDVSYQYGYTNELHREKGEIRHIAVAIGIPSICLSLITFVWSFIYLFVTTKFMGISYFDAITLTEDAAVQQILQIILSILMFLVPFPIAARCAGYKISSLIKTDKPIKKTGLPFFMIGVGFCCFANIADSYSTSLFEGFGIKYEVDYIDDPRGVFGFILSFIATAIVPALVEEFACRGIVLGLLRKYGEGFAIVVSSIIFGVMHGNFDQIPFAVFVGLIFGYIYVKTNSIWISIAVHLVNNAIAVIYSYLENYMSANMQDLSYLVYLIFGLLATIFGIYMLSALTLSNSKKDTQDKVFENFGLNSTEMLSTNKQKYTYFFTSWVIVLFFACNIYEALTYFVK